MSSFKIAVEFIEKWLGRAHLASWLNEHANDFGMAMVAATLIYALWVFVRSHSQPVLMALAGSALIAFAMMGISQADRLLGWLRSRRDDTSSSAAGEESCDGVRTSRDRITYDTALSRVVEQLTASEGATPEIRAELCIKTCGLIRQKAHDGDLVVWGRKQISPGGPRTKSATFSEIFTEIPREYWVTSKLVAGIVLQATQTNQPDTEPQSPGAWSGFKGNAFTELKVNWLQVLSLWPALERPIPLHRAAAEFYQAIHDTDVAKRIRGECDSYNEILNAVGDMILARSNVLARRPNSHDFEKVPKWRLRYAKLHGGARILRKLTLWSRSEVIFVDLQISHSDFCRAMHQVQSIIAEASTFGARRFEDQ